MSRIAEKIQRFHKGLPSGVKLVAVSKFHPLEDILEAYSAGQRIFAESRPQELYEKVQILLGRQADAISAHFAGQAGWNGVEATAHVGAACLSQMEFHFIGHLQTNKLKLVLPYVTMVQSVDSLHLLEAIDRWCLTNGRRMDVLLEYHVSADETKQGFSRDEILEILGRAGDFAGINFRGLMGMASLTEDALIIRSDFARIKALFDEIRSSAANLTAFDQLSIGMSGDWKIALEYGSTMVRIGTAIFGERK